MTTENDRAPPSTGAASTRMQPGRQERIRVDAQAPVVRSTVLIEKRLQAASLVGIEGIGTSPDQFAPNEDLRNGGHGSARSQRRADFSAAILFLILDRVQINRAITDAVPREHLSNCPAKLAPFEGKHHDRLLAIAD